MSLPKVQVGTKLRDGFVVRKIRPTEIVATRPYDNKTIHLPITEAFERAVFPAKPKKALRVC